MPNAVVSLSLDRINYKTEAIDGRTMPQDCRLEVKGDGQSVWVNRDGVCVARFGPGGIDIYASANKLAAAPGCRSEDAHDPTPEDWFDFRRKVSEFFNIQIPADLYPTFLGMRH